MKQKSNSLPNYRFNFLGAIVLFLGGMAPVLLISAVNVALLFVTKENFQYKDWFMPVTNALMWLGAILAYDYMICRQQTGRKLNFNMSPKNVMTYLLIFPLMLGMIFIAEFVTAQIPISGPVFGELYRFFEKMMNQLSGDTPTMILLAVIMAPLFEEIVFRGIMMKGMINNGVKPIYAIWISAFIFGVVHANPWQFAGAVLLGYVLGLVYHRTKSLLMPILLHAFNNLISTILIKYHNTENFADAFNISEYAVLVAGIVLFVIFYLLFTKKFEIAHSE